MSVSNVHYSYQSHYSASLECMVGLDDGWEECVGGEECVGEMLSVVGWMLDGESVMLR